MHSKIGRFLKKSSFETFCFEFDQNDDSQAHVNVDCGVNNRPIIFKRRVVNEATKLFNSLF